MGPCCTLLGRAGDTLCIIVDAFVQDDYEVHIGEELVRYVQGENVDMEEYEIVSQGN